MSSGEPVIPQRPTLNVSRESAEMPDASGAWLDTAGVLVRSVVMVAMAALAISCSCPRQSPRRPQFPIDVTVVEVAIAM